MVNSQFTFHNVGQGLFYTGTLFNGKFHFVYDCGTENAIIFIKNAVTSYHKSDFIDSNQNIDFLVISHFHKDHISGVKLLGNNHPIKKIYVPFTHPDLILIQLLLDDSDPNKSTTSLLAEFLEIKEIIFDDRGNVKENVEVIEEQEEIIVNNNNHFGVGLSWKFILLNRGYDKEVQEKYLEFIRDMIKPYESLVEYVKNESKKQVSQLLKSINVRVKQLGCDPNEISLMMLHYPFNNRNNKVKFSKSRCTSSYLYGTGTTNRNTKHQNEFIANHMLASLLTGDGTVTTTVSQKLFQLSHLDNISLLYFQIPHHGSNKQWNNSNLSPLHTITSGSMFNICSYGIGNKYGHPGIDVVKSPRNKLYIVTQLHNFKYEIYI